MPIIDMHCDTLMHAFLKYGENADLRRMPDGMVDLERMKAGDVWSQFFAIFIPPIENYRIYMGMDPIPEDVYIRGCYTVFNNNLEKNRDIIAPVYKATDILENRKNNKMSVVLTMEDGVAVHGSMDKIKMFYEMGIRALSLTWNQENCFGYPNSREPAIMQKGLKTFGKEAITYMQELGMLVDVSHLSDGGFYDVAEICKKPFVATHSNCRSICRHPRNLTDDMIRTLAECGGVAGINFGPEFVNSDMSDEESAINKIVDMIVHMKNIGGIDVIGIGSDFDGISGKLEVSDSSKYSLLVDALEKKHFTTYEIEKITYKNVLRVVGECL